MGDEVARDSGGEGEPAAARKMRARVGVGIWIAFAEPALPWPDPRRGQRRAALDHVPGRADAENQCHRESADEVAQHAHGRAALFAPEAGARRGAVSYTHLRAHETDSYLVCRLL